MSLFRKYGNSPFNIALIHGGPGAAGEMAPVATELLKKFSILELFQTKLSIEGLIQELFLILDKEATPPITLIGHSWGAWLALIYATRFSSSIKKLIMIGSGPFQDEYAKDIMITRYQRLDEKEKTELQLLLAMLEYPGNKDRNKTFKKVSGFIRKADSYDPIDLSDDAIECRYDIFQNIWKEAEELRKSGELLRIAGNINCPVVAIHGDYDPHPAEGVSKLLSNAIRDFKFILIEKCGHEPWNEKYAKEKFYSILSKELDD
jgi:pimeloyl-ACP methyl ester carboxylesterase